MFKFEREIICEEGTKRPTLEKITCKRNKNKTIL